MRPTAALGMMWQGKLLRRTAPRLRFGRGRLNLPPPAGCLPHSTASRTLTASSQGESSASDELDALFKVLPDHLRHSFVDGQTDSPEIVDNCNRANADSLLEIVADLGRCPRVRFGRFHAEDIEQELSGVPVSDADLRHLNEHPDLTEWTSDDRAGIRGTLHRLARMRNASTGKVYGMTLRVGRPQIGITAPIADELEEGSSILLLGPPGVGKTTILRETARVLSDDHGRRVLIVDTSNEIAGGGDVIHPSVGDRTRRMMVGRREEQHRTMLQAVQNHTPEVIIIDEIGTNAEACAAASISERGVALIATAHGLTLRQLVQNPELNILVGGIETAILSDATAKLHGGSKIVQQRRQRPVFDVLVEINPEGPWLVHTDLAASVDRLLAKKPLLQHARGKQQLAAAGALDTATMDKSQVTGLGEDRDAVLPLRECLPSALIEQVEAGSAYVLSFDGGVAAGESAAAAVLSRLRSGRLRAQAKGLPRVSALLEERRCWRFFIDKESTPDRMEVAGLLAGLHGLRDCMASIQPQPTTLIIQGDSQVIIGSVRMALSSSQSCKTGSALNDQNVQALCREAAEELKLLGAEMVVELLWRPRRFNHLADAEVHRAKDEQRGNCSLHSKFVKALPVDGPAPSSDDGRVAALTELQDRNGLSVQLEDCLFKKDFEGLEQALHQGHDPNVTMGSGMSLLEEVLSRWGRSTNSVSSVYMGLAALLVTHGADVNYRGKRGTCLHSLVHLFASSRSWGNYNSKQVLRRMPALWHFVLSAGGDASIQDGAGRTVDALMLELNVSDALTKLVQQAPSGR